MRQDPTCPLDFEAVAEEAPPRRALDRWRPDEEPDECPEGFDPDRVLAPAGCTEDCTAGVARGARSVAVVAVGPGGSGHFWSVGIAVSGGWFACMTASTVAWRYLGLVGDRLSPLHWLDDVDGDGAQEVVLWERLPWGGAEADNGLIPIVYVLDGDALVRRDDLAMPLRHRVATAYDALFAREGGNACLHAVANALR